MEPPTSRTNIPALAFVDELNVAGKVRLFVNHPLSCRKIFRSASVAQRVVVMVVVVVDFLVVLISLKLVLHELDIVVGNNHSDK
jgi:hypothetical protein